MSTALTLRKTSPRARFGCKGPLAEAWLQECGFAVPQAPNSWACGADGVLVARLATSEFLVEALSESPARVAGIALQLQDFTARRAGLYPVVREDCVLELAGERANEVLLEICSFNFVPLAEAAQASAGTVVMTMMIGAGVTIVLRREARGLVYTIWCDPSFGHYLQSTLENITRQLEDAV